MKKLVGIIAIALSVMSCTAEPITMKQTNPYQGVDIKGTWFMDVVNDQPTKTYKKTDNVNIKYNAQTNILLINGVNYEVTEINPNAIRYVKEGLIYVIEFNAGYVWQDGITRTKFTMYEDGEENHNYTVYTYFN